MSQALCYLVKRSKISTWIRIPSLLLKQKDRYNDQPTNPKFLAFTRFRPKATTNLALSLKHHLNLLLTWLTNVLHQYALTKTKAWTYNIHIDKGIEIRHKSDLSRDVCSCQTGNQVFSVTFILTTVVSPQHIAENEKPKDNQEPSFSLNPPTF